MMPTLPSLAGHRRLMLVLSIIVTIITHHSNNVQAFHSSLLRHHQKTLPASPFVVPRRLSPLVLPPSSSCQKMMTIRLAASSPRGDGGTIKTKKKNESKIMTTPLTVAVASLIIASTTWISPALAVSGGGLDYANLDLSGEDFSNGNYKGKDFTQVIAKGTSFAKSSLLGCRFYKAYLVNADFSGADLRGASLEDTSMDGANLKDANLSGSYFSASLLDAGNIENADFTDAQLPPKLQPRICDRPDAKGTNPVTGIETRDSLMCP